MNPYEIIMACADTSSRNEKIRILKENSSDLLAYVLEAATSPYIVFGVKEFQLAEAIGHDDFTINLNQLKFCLHHLRMRDVKGTIRDFIFETSKHLNSQQQKVLTWILKKDLEAGVDLKTVQKAFPELIQEFNVSLCKPVEMSKVTYPCGIELKMNGRRNIAVVIGGTVTHYSRNGKENENFHTFDDELIRLAAGVDSVFDGEVHGNVAGENKLNRRKEKQQALRKTNVDMSGLVFTIWDQMPVGMWRMQKCTTPYRVRREMLMVAFREAQSRDNFTKIVLIDSKIVHNEEELQKEYRRAIRHGDEGVVIKEFESGYDFKRSNSWMKYKPTTEIDVPIVKVLEGKGKFKDAVGSLVVDHKGVHVHCGMGKGVTLEDQKTMWKNRKKLIGKIVEVVTTGITLDGSLEVGKFVRIRDDLDE